MAATARVLAVVRWNLVAVGHRARRLPNRLGEREQVVIAGRGRLELAVRAYQVPTSGRGQATCVLLTQVVRVRLAEGRKRTDDGCRIGVHVGQRRDGRPGATVARAAPW
jgi:hypothetical protein